MNKYVGEFLKQVTQEVKYKKIHPYLMNEMEDHIEMLKEDYIEEGLTEEEAYEKAIRQMGDAKSIGQAFHKTHQPKMAWSVLCFMGLLVAVGIASLMFYGEMANMTNIVSNHWKKQLLFSCIGMLTLLGTYFMSYKIWENKSIWLYAGGNLILLSLMLFGNTVNGQRVFLSLGPISISPIYLAVPLILMAYVEFTSLWRGDKKGAFILMGLGLLPTLLIAKANLFNALLLIIMLLSIIILYICSREFKGDKKACLIKLGLLVVIGGSLVASYLLSKDIFRKRLLGFLYPSSYAQDEGYIYEMLKAVRAQASLIGGNGLSALGRESNLFSGAVSEFILTFIIGRFGWLVGGIVLLILGLTIIQLFRVAFTIRESYGRLLALTIATYFAIEFIINILMNLGYFPQVTSYLPFVSYGGTIMICDMMYLGIFLNIYRKKDVIQCEIAQG